MSLMRYSTDPEWEDVPPMYVYFAASHLSDTGMLTGLDGATPRQYIEVVMQTLAQSGELDDDTLDDCHAALRSRLRVTEDDE